MMKTINYSFNLENLWMNINGKKLIFYWVVTFCIQSLFVSIWLELDWIVWERLNLAVTWSQNKCKIYNKWFLLEKYLISACAQVFSEINNRSSSVMDILRQMIIFWSFTNVSFYGNIMEFLAPLKNLQMSALGANAARLFCFHQCTGQIS